MVRRSRADDGEAMAPADAPGARAALPRGSECECVSTGAGRDPCVIASRSTPLPPRWPPCLLANAPDNAVDPPDMSPARLARAADIAGPLVASAGGAGGYMWCVAIPVVRDAASPLVCANGRAHPPCRMAAVVGVVAPIAASPSACQKPWLEANPPV